MKKRENARKSCDCGRQYESKEDRCEHCEYRRNLATLERSYHAPSHLRASLVGLIYGCLVLALCIKPGLAQVDINIEKLATAIKMAENSRSKPYGIMLSGCDAKHEAWCRKACIQTIENNIKRWDKAGNPGTFLEFLGSKYAPINAPNDPNNLNVNWVRNVTYFYNEVL